MKWAVLLGALFLDQISKWLVVTRLKEIGTFPVIEGIFHLQYLENRGAAFGLLQDQMAFFVIVTVVVTGGILFFLFTEPNSSTFLQMALSLIAGGALGNLVDRIRFGYVIDFFDFQIWPVFNVADTAIVLGQIMLIVYLLKMNRDHSKGESI